MKRLLMSLSLGAAVSGVMAAPVAAGGTDWNGISNYQGVPAAVPVPAAIPVPTYSAEWYFRVDGGIGFAGDEPDASGSPFGYDPASGPPPVPFATLATAMGFSPSYDVKNHGAYANAGFGVGYIWNRHLRFDLTADFNSEVSMTGVQRTRYDDGGGADGRVANATDTVKFDRQLYLANAYYDFANRESGFTPYVGIGLGLANTKMRRTLNAYEAQCGDPTCSPALETPDTSFSGTVSNRDLTFAASLMAGATYRLTDVTSLDFNYRFLFVTEPEGANMAGSIAGNAETSLGSTTEHQLRAGLRFEVN
jgi:opacity protein-like surface antigen